MQYLINSFRFSTDYIHSRKYETALQTLKPVSY